MGRYSYTFQSDSLHHNRWFGPLSDGNGTTGCTKDRMRLKVLHNDLIQVIFV